MLVLSLHKGTEKSSPPLILATVMWNHTFRGVMRGLIGTVKGTGWGEGGKRHGY